MDSDSRVMMKKGIWKLTTEKLVTYCQLRYMCNIVDSEWTQECRLGHTL